VRRPPLLVALLLGAACAKREATPPAAPTGTPLAARPAAPSVPLPAGVPPTPDPRVVAAQREMSDKVASYALTAETLDKILLCEKDLADFWADPEKARSIRGQLSLAAIYEAIGRTPRVAKTLEAFHLAPPDYVLGTFAMMGGYAYESIRRSDPNRVLGKAPPVTWATLEVIQRRYDDVQRLVMPRPTPPPGAPAAPRP